MDKIKYLSLVERPVIQPVFHRMRNTKWPEIEKKKCFERR